MESFIAIPQKQTPLSFDLVTRKTNRLAIRDEYLAFTRGEIACTFYNYEEVRRDYYDSLSDDEYDPYDSEAYGAVDEAEMTRLTTGKNRWMRRKTLDPSSINDGDIELWSALVCNKDATIEEAIAAGCGSEEFYTQVLQRDPMLVTTFPAPHDASFLFFAFVAIEKNEKANERALLEHELLRAAVAHFGHAHPAMINLYALFPRMLRDTLARNDPETIIAALKLNHHVVYFASPRGITSAVVKALVEKLNIRDGAIVTFLPTDFVESIPSKITTAFLSPLGGKGLDMLIAHLEKQEKKRTR